jgi:hypothetical protein
MMKPVVPDVAVKLTVSPPQEIIWSGPSKNQNKGFPKGIQSTVVGA